MRSWMGYGRAVRRQQQGLGILMGLHWVCTLERLPQNSGLWDWLTFHQLHCDMDFLVPDVVQKVLINDGLAKFLLCWRLEKPKFLAVDQGVHLAAKKLRALWKTCNILGVLCTHVGAQSAGVLSWQDQLLKMMTNGVLFLSTMGRELKKSWDPHCVYVIM